jgi:hypothetical protein
VIVTSFFLPRTACPRAVLAAYRDGITVIGELAAQFSEVAWLAATPCPEWRAADLAGHLRCVADDYHEYPDDAPASRLARLLAAWRGGTPQLWPGLPAGTDSGDPWRLLLRATGRDPGWVSV